MRAADLPLHYNAVDILERNLPERADKDAILTAERIMTFSQVSAEVNQVGNALRKLGLRRREYVGILSLDCCEWVTTFFATLKIGCVAIGMNTLLTAGEYEFIMHDSRCRVIVVHEALLSQFEQIRDRLPWVLHVVVIGTPRHSADQSYRNWILNEPTELEAAGTHREEMCTLNYSSGTTGQPKGIEHAHKDLPLTAQLWGINVLGLTENDRTFAAAKLFFTFGLGGNLIFPWYAGASVVLLSGSSRVAQNVLDAVDRFAPTVLYDSPTGYAQLMAQPALTEATSFSSLRICVSAGEALPAPVWNEWKEKTGLDILDGIGSTEIFHIFLSNRPSATQPGYMRPGSSGKPFEGYEIKLMGEDGKEADEGEVGNLWVRGETTSLSYLHQYERSRKTFIGDWCVTGDKYYVDEDGFYWYAGRADDMLKVGGIWTSPVEVESTLSSHPAVVECAVVGRRDQSDLVKPKAYVILNSGFEAGDLLVEELIEHCRSHMAQYKRPRWIEFVDELPKTASGKIQRFKLRG